MVVLYRIGVCIGVISYCWYKGIGVGIVVSYWCRYCRRYCCSGIGVGVLVSYRIVSYCIGVGDGIVAGLGVAGLLCGL